MVLDAPQVFGQGLAFGRAAGSGCCGLARRAGFSLQGIKLGLQTDLVGGHRRWFRLIKPWWARTGRHNCIALVTTSHSRHESVVQLT